jgi:hypothetical protein
MKIKLNSYRQIFINVVKCIVFVILFLLVDYSLSLLLTSGLKKYYGLNKPAKILLIGHSHTMLGLNKNLMEEELHCNVAKYAVEGANVRDRLAMIKHFLHINGDSVKIITYDVDPTFLTGSGISKNSYTLFYPFMDDPYIEEYIRKEKPKKIDFLIKKYLRTSRFDDLNLNGALRGHLGFYSNVKVGTIDTLAFKKRIANNDFVRITFDKDLKTDFEETLKYLSNKNIKIVLLFLPTLDILNKAEPEKYNKALTLLYEYSKKYQNVYFFNYNNEYSKKSELFYDSVHLNPKGNRIITERVIEDLRKIL